MSGSDGINSAVFHCNARSAFDVVCDNWDISLKARESGVPTPPVQFVTAVRV